MQGPRTAFPSHRRSPTRGHDETVTHLNRSKVRSGLSTESLRGCALWDCSTTDMQHCPKHCGLPAVPPTWELTYTVARAQRLSCLPADDCRARIAANGPDTLRCGRYCARRNARAARSLARLRAVVCGLADAMAAAAAWRVLGGV